MPDLQKLAVLVALALGVVACAEEKKAAESNVGAACGGEDDCTGSADICLITQTLSGFGVTAGGIVRYRGGYCTSACRAHTDCGKAGKCPIGQAITEASIPAQYRSAANEIVETASNCYQPCMAQSECRDGYQCNTIPAALTGNGSRSDALDFVLNAIIEGSIASDKYCLPSASSPADAGAADASADGSG
jgi:hypothetical protein